MEVEDRIRDELSQDYLNIKKENSFMFDNIDSFVTLSRENTNVKAVELYLFDSHPGNYELWDKVGRIVENLTEVHTLSIHSHTETEPDDDDDEDDESDDGDEAPMPDWEILTRILPYLRRKVELYLSTEESTDDDDEVIEEIQGLARAIHGHPMISGFCSTMAFSFANMGPLCSTLATLPSLENILLGFGDPETEDQRDLVNVEPLRELLRTPALRIVEFEGFCFTDALCHAAANALEVGSSVTSITFQSGCSFPFGGRAIITNALKRNTTVTNVKLHDDCDESFCTSLAAVLLCNSTLRKVTLQLPQITCGRWLSPTFLSLGMNTTLKKITAKIFDRFGDELCAAISSGLAENSSLEKLSLYGMHSTDDDGALWARNALSFLRTNSTLKYLTVTFERVQDDIEEPYVSAFRLEAVKMMEDNTCLESLTIATDSQIRRQENPLFQSTSIRMGSKVKFEELSVLVSALQRDTTLKTLGFQTSSQTGFQTGFRLSSRIIFLTDDEVDQLVPILMKNYGLERLEPDIRCTDDRTVKAIFRLNGAGRRYLIEDESSISKGVDVLSAVNDDINCVFLHLLENPGLCYRKAAETPTSRRSTGAKASSIKIR
jgi:hypothetical protein